MREEYGCDPLDMRAALGPAISGERYEVGEECHAPFSRAAPELERFRGASREGANGCWTFPLAARLQLASAGIPDERIGAPGPCTFSESSRFFSYRRDGPPTGRLLSAIWITA